MMIHLGFDSNFYDSKKENFEDGGATAIFQIAFLNRDFLTCKLLFNKFVHRLGHVTRPNTRPILALKAY